MTEPRLFAAWLRSLAGLAALAGLLGLSACGGGSGAPNNVYDTPGPLTVLPAVRHRLFGSAHRADRHRRNAAVPGVLLEFGPRPGRADRGG